MFDITPIIEAIIGLAAAVITCFVVPYIKSKTTAAQQAEIKGWATIAVAAAEQIYASGDGAAKKQYVVDFLAAHGVTVDEAKIDAYIEGAVYEIKNGQITVGNIGTMNYLGSGLSGAEGGVADGVQ